MANLEELYNKSSHPSVVGGREASEGKKEVNTFDMTSQFQNNFNARTPGDRKVIIGRDPSDNNGNFTQAAFDYYNADALRIIRPTSFKPDTNFKQWSPNKKYAESNSTRPGIVYRY